MDPPALHEARDILATRILARAAAGIGVATEARSSTRGDGLSLIHI